MKFRPCIDLHEGKVKQIVGETLSGIEDRVSENFVSPHGAAYFAEMYRNAALPGGHVIMLGPGNETEALAALTAYPNGMQIGGGINADNAERWINVGASHVIVTSFIFHSDGIDRENLAKLIAAVGRDHIVLDLSCKKSGDVYKIAVDGWRRTTEIEVGPALLDDLAESCDEFLIHAVDVEGKNGGADDELIAMLGKWGRKPVTYAGGISSFEGLERAKVLGRNKVDISIGSALDIFGGKLAFEDVTQWFRKG